MGPLLEKLVGALKLNPLIAAQYTRLNGQLRQHSGLDLERDVLAGISDVGAFARGTSLRSLDAGVVVVARDRAALRRTVAGATFTGPGVQELLHSATVAICGGVTVDRLWHAVPSFPTISEVWLHLLEAYGL